MKNKGKKCFEIVEKVFGYGNLESWEYEDALNIVEYAVDLATEEVIIWLKENYDVYLQEVDYREPLKNSVKIDSLLNDLKQHVKEDEDSIWQ